ncbi:hypothetical protein OSTOST_01656 [Ostertagia ostertagi]
MGARTRGTENLERIVHSSRALPVNGIDEAERRDDSSPPPDQVGEENTENSELTNEDTRNQSRKRELVLSEDMSNKISRSDGGE